MKPAIGLYFNGQCEAAFRFYEQSLPAKITFMLHWEDSPASKDVAPEWGKKVWHATLQVGGLDISAGDLPAEKYVGPQGFNFILNIDRTEEADRLFGALSQNGTVLFPLQETPWSPRYGMVTDQFGLSWQINCEGKSESR